MEPCAFDEDQVQSLSVFRDGQVVISCWKPSKEELVEILRTGRVWLVVCGMTMPPVIVTGVSPFGSETGPTD